MPGSRNGDTTEFARRLRERRIQLRLTRKQLATKMDVTVTAVSNWENGKSFPQLSKRSLLCTVLETTAKDILLPPYNTDH